MLLTLIFWFLIRNILEAIIKKKMLDFYYFTSPLEISFLDKWKIRKSQDTRRYQGIVVVIQASCVWCLTQTQNDRHQSLTCITNSVFTECLPASEVLGWSVLYSVEKWLKRDENKSTWGHREEVNQNLEISEWKNKKRKKCKSVIVGFYVFYIVFQIGFPSISSLSV